MLVPFDVQDSCMKVRNVVKELQIMGLPVGEIEAMVSLTREQIATRTQRLSRNVMSQPPKERLRQGREIRIELCVANR